MIDADADHVHGDRRQGTLALMDGPTVLDAEATTLRARALVRAGLLAPAQLDDARDLVSGREDVPAIVRSLLLLVGITLLACAVVFFVAANWSVLAASARMGLVALGIVVSAGVALHVGVKTRGGHAAVTLAGLLIGPLLMLYGQTYQTGADAWELFFGWALLLLPFIAATRALGLSLVALALVHVVVPLFMAQQLGFAADEDGALAAGIVLVLVDGGALAGLELSQRRWRVAARRGPRAVALLGALVAFTGGTIAIVEQHAHDGLRAGALALAAAFAVLLLSSTWLRRSADLFFTAVGSFLLAGLSLVLSGKLLFDELRLETAGLFLEGFLVLAVVGGLTRLLLHLHRSGGHAAEEEP